MVKYREIGRKSIKLLKENEKSLFKLLYQKDISAIDTKVALRNEYLKQIVNFNEGYFPKELTFDKYKRILNTNQDGKI